MIVGQNNYHFLILIAIYTVHVELIVVKCSQTGKNLTIKAENLSKENFEPLTKDDFVAGTALIVHYKGKPYPVEFIQFKGNLLSL